MELHCQIGRGVEPDLLDRLSGLEPNEAVCTARLCLTTTSSRQLVPAGDLARVFGSIIHRLAEGRPVALLFPHDVRTIKRKLRKLDVESTKERNALHVEISPPHLPLLIAVLEAGAFTTFYARVGRGEVTPGFGTAQGSEFQPPLKDLGQNYFVAVLTLYDESMELLSNFVPAELIINAVREIGAEEGVQVFC